MAEHPDDDPFYYYFLKYDNDNRFRKLLDKNNISVEEYCYLEEKCRIEMCGYLIKHFRFSGN